jgi:hypothetical protein
MKNICIQYTLFIGVKYKKLKYFFLNNQTNQTKYQHGRSSC